MMVFVHLYKQKSWKFQDAQALGPLLKVKLSVGYM